MLGTILSFAKAGGERAFNFSGNNRTTCTQERKGKPRKTQGDRISHPFERTSCSSPDSKSFTDERCPDKRIHDPGEFKFAEIIFGLLSSIETSIKERLSALSDSLLRGQWRLVV